MSRSDQCHMCKGYGHHQAQCPNQFVGLSNKHNLEEEVNNPNDVMVLEVENDLEDQVNGLDEDRSVHVLRHLLPTRAIKEEDWRHNSIFHT